jgi:hypothetical protein
LGDHGLDDDVLVPSGVGPEFGIVFIGANAGDAIGLVADTAGDFNGDGLSDLLISAPGADPAPKLRGQVYVIYGGLEGDESGQFDLRDVNGVNGFAIKGPVGLDPPGPKIGEYAIGFGDINNDGFDDIGVGVDYPAPGDWVGVVFGGPNVGSDGLFCLEDLNGDNGFQVVRTSGGNASNPRLYRAGDISDDGVDELFVGVFKLNLFYGAGDIGQDGIIELPEEVDGRAGFTVSTGTFHDARGSVGDVNHDGIGDFAYAGEYYVDYCDVGEVGVFFGRRMGDGDLDADVDFADFGGFQKCFAAQLSNTDEDGEPDVPDACHPFDFDKDNDIDLEDYAAFEEAFGTPP